jgi:hypothetical protein
MHKFGYLGSKRYIKLTLDIIGTATNTCSAIAVRGLPHIAPITGN